MSKTTPEQQHLRWLKRRSPLSLEVAEASRDAEIHCLQNDIDVLREQLEHFKTLPLATYTTEYVPVFPGDPDYAAAEDMFDPAEYRGTWHFKSEMLAKNA